MNEKKYECGSKVNIYGYCFDEEEGNFFKSLRKYQVDPFCPAKGESIGKFILEANIFAIKSIFGFCFNRRQD